MTMPNPSQSSQGVPAMQEVYRKAFKDIVILIEFIRRCRTPEEYYYLQQQLEEHIDRVDEAAEDAIQHKAGQERDFYHKLGHQYRTVGDALAWQVYAFQALPIYALGRNQFPGYRTRFKRKGLEEEKKQIIELWETHGAFALHHDCTNCLRIGDLSIFYPDQLNMPELHEVKVAGREATSHQKRRMRIATDLATKHHSIQDEQYDIMHRIHTLPKISTIEQTNLGLLWHALLQAREHGIGFAANTYLALTVMDPIRCTEHQFNQLQQEWVQTANKMLFPDIWPLHCTDELISDSWERIARPNIGVLYTIYPLSSDYVAAIVTGRVRIHYRLNTNAITQALCDAGLEAECLLGEWHRLGRQPPRKAKAAYFRVRRKGMPPIHLEDLPIHQMWFEGLRLEDFVASVVTYFDEQIWNKHPSNSRGRHSSSTTSSSVRYLYQYGTYLGQQPRLPHAHYL